MPIRSLEDILAIMRLFGSWVHKGNKDSKMIKSFVILSLTYSYIIILKKSKMGEKHNHIKSYMPCMCGPIPLSVVAISL